MDPGAWDGDGKDTPLGRVEPKAAWDELHMGFTDAQIMNRALVTRFMAHGSS